MFRETATGEPFALIAGATVIADGAPRSFCVVGPLVVRARSKHGMQRVPYFVLLDVVHGVAAIRPVLVGVHHDFLRAEVEDAVALVIIIPPISARDRTFLIPARPEGRGVVMTHLSWDRRALSNHENPCRTYV